MGGCGCRPKLDHAPEEPARRSRRHILRETTVQVLHTLTAYAEREGHMPHLATLAETSVHPVHQVEAVRVASQAAHLVGVPSPGPNADASKRAGRARGSPLLGLPSHAGRPA